MAEDCSEESPSVEISFDLTEWVDRQGYDYIEKDYPVGGEIWRVHKHDPDPYPSRPHAHCISGRKRLVGCKLHLGSRQLFTKHNSPLDRYMRQDQFDRLIEMVRK